MNRTVYSSVGEVAPLAFTGDDPRAYIIIGCIMGIILICLCFALCSCLCNRDWCLCAIIENRSVAVVVPEPINVVIVPVKNDRNEVYKIRE
jgi:hypothetical protein